MNRFTTKQKNISILLKLITIISALTGTFFSAYAGRGSFMGGLSVCMYFTIQSNVALAIVCLIGLSKMLGGREISDRWYVIKFVATVSITLTGFVFCFVLAPTMGRYAWNFQNILTHVVVPITSILDFFVVGVNSRIAYKSDIYVILPPIAYAIYAGIGYVRGWEFAPGVNYPYFFLNWGSPAGAFGFSKELPFMGCAWWILALFVFLLLIGALYFKIVSMMKKVVKH